MNHNGSTSSHKDLEKQARPVSENEGVSPKMEKHGEVAGPITWALTTKTKKRAAKLIPGGVLDVAPRIAPPESVDPGGMKLKTKWQYSHSYTDPKTGRAVTVEKEYRWDPAKHKWVPTGRQRKK